MARLFANKKGAARWVAILASALLIQLGLCSIAPFVLRLALSRSGSDDSPLVMVPVVQAALFLLTLIALCIAALVALIERIASRKAK